MTTPLPRRMAQLVALGRIGIGCTALVAPTLMTRPWIGDSARSPDARLLARTMGGRDLALGIGTALGEDTAGDGDGDGDGADARAWVALAGMADTVDAVVTILAFRRLPTLSRWGILASTVGAAAVSFWAAAGLDPRLDPRLDLPTTPPAPLSGGTAPSASTPAGPTP